MPKSLPEVLDTQVPIEKFARALHWIAEERRRMKDFQLLVNSFHFCCGFLCDATLDQMTKFATIEEFVERRWIKRGVSGRWVEGWIPDGDVDAALNPTKLASGVTIYSPLLISDDSCLEILLGQPGPKSPYIHLVYEDEHEWRMRL